MKITVGNAVKKPKLKNCYMINITFMHGDADKYEDIEMGPFKKDDITELEDAILTCERMERAYPCGRGGGDDYSEDIVKGYDKWFSYHSDNNLAVPVPGDCTCDGMCEASFSSYELFYYDENGVKYNVDVEIDEEEVGHVGEEDEEDID